MDLRIVTWNIACGAKGYENPNISGQAKLLKSLSPDFVFLQEVDKNCETSFVVDVAQKLAEALNFQSCFAKQLKNLAESLATQFLQKTYHSLKV